MKTKTEVSGVAAATPYRKGIMNKLLIWLVLIVGTAQAVRAQTGFLAPSNAAPAIELAWNASPDPTATGYFIYEGTNSGQYSIKTSTGTNTMLAVSNMVRGVTYYFNVTAQNNAGLESVFAGEINYKAALPPAAPSLKPIIILTVQNSPSLLHPTWATVGSVPLLADQQAGFYRVQIKN